MSNLHALPANHANRGRQAVSNKQLTGSWVSTDLSGDGIWLIVDTVNITFTDDGAFDATAVMNVGGNSTYTGPYKVLVGKIKVQPKGVGKLICTFKLENGILTLNNDEYGVTAKFKRSDSESSQQSSDQSGGFLGL